MELRYLDVFMRGIFLSECCNQIHILVWTKLSLQKVRLQRVQVRLSLNNSIKEIIVSSLVF